MVDIGNIGWKEVINCKYYPYTVLSIQVTLFCEILVPITATCKINEHQIGVIVAVIRAGYRLAPKCVGYMGLVWAERNNIHTLPITRQLWVVFLQSGSFISALRVFLLSCRFKYVSLLHHFNLNITVFTLLTQLSPHEFVYTTSTSEMTYTFIYKQKYIKINDL